MKAKSNLLKFIAFILFTQLIAGCGTAYKVTPVLSTRIPSIETWTERPQWYERLYRLDRSVFLNPYTYNPGNTTAVGRNLAANRESSLYWIAVNDPSNTKRMEARNLLQNAIMRLSDQMTAAHLSELKSTENNGNLLFGAATLGLTGGASVAGPAAASALSAAATGTGGARELFNDQVYRNALVETLIGAVESDRESFAAVIFQMQKKSIGDYDVEAAIRDANEYHQRGSFYHGLSLIREAAETDNRQKRKEAKDKRTSQINSSTNALPQ